MTTAHIFIGSTPYGQDAEFQMALEYSIRKHASIPVMIYWMVADENPDSPWSGWDRSQWYTPFTGFRWAIPEVAAGMGLDQAIFMDHDFIIQHDIAHLWNQPFQDGKLLMGKGGTSTGRFCIMKMNVPEILPYLPSLELMKKIPESAAICTNWFSGHFNRMCQQFKGTWNTIDGEGLNHEDIYGYHFSDVRTQPHLATAIARMEKQGITHWAKISEPGLNPKDGKEAEGFELFYKYYNEAVEASKGNILRDLTHDFG